MKYRINCYRNNLNAGKIDKLQIRVFHYAIVNAFRKFVKVFVL